MKKIIIILVVVLAAAFGIAPNFIGQQAETQLKGIYAKMGEAPEFSVVVTEYNRGWFSSSAVVELSLNLADFDPTMEENLVFKMTNTMKHGPVLTDVGGFGFGLIDIDASMEFPELVTKEMPEFNESFNDLFSLKSRMYFDGSSYNETELKEFNFSEERINISINPARFVGTTTTDGKVTAKGSWDGMSISDNGTFGFTMGEMALDFDLRAMEGNIYDPSAIYLGDGTMNLAQIRITGQGIPGVVELNELTAKSTSDAKDGLLFGDLDMGVAEINAMGLSFTNFVMNQTFKNLDIDSLKKINELNRSLTEQNMEAKMTELGEVAMGMLAKKPVFHVRELGMMSAQGQIGSEMTFTLDETLIDTTNPETVVNALKIDGSGYLPEAFLTAMGLMPMAQGFIDAGYLKRDAENLTFEFNMANGQMTVSGLPLPLGPTN